MRSWPLLLSLAACDRVFGLDRPPVDAFEPDAPPIDAAPVCATPTELRGLHDLAGSFLDFSPSDDGMLAVVNEMAKANYTVSTGGATLGGMTQSTGILSQVGRVSLSPDGMTLYLYMPSAGVGAMIQVSRRGAGPGDWMPTMSAGLPDGIPGRPTRDGTRIFIENGGAIQEFAGVGGAWIGGTAYTAGDFGHRAGATMSYANLSDDGRYLLYVLSDGTGSGIYVRERATVGGTFAGSAVAGPLLGGEAGALRSPTFTEGCTKLYAVRAVLSNGLPDLQNGTPFVAAVSR